jgi:chromate transport protein ChrA
MVQVVVLEEKNAAAARARSVSLVTGRTGRVLGFLVVCYLFVLPPALAVAFAPLSFGTASFLDFALESLLAPLTAYLLAAAYYRLSEPGRPVIHPRVLAWGSVWEGR